MTTEYISLKATMPVKEALMHVKEQAPDAETIYVILQLMITNNWLGYSLLEI